MGTSMEEFRKIMAAQQTASTSDQNYPLNQIARQQQSVQGPKMSKQEFADLQHDLMSAAANQEKIPGLMQDKNISEEAKQKAIAQQRRLIAEMHRTPTPNNGARDPKQGNITSEEQAILNLAQRTGFKVPDDNPDQSVLQRVEKRSAQQTIKQAEAENAPIAIPTTKQQARPIQNTTPKSAFDDLYAPPEDETPEPVVL
jgi:hypothetical protein